MAVRQAAIITLHPAPIYFDSNSPQPIPHSILLTLPSSALPPVIISTDEHASVSLRTCHARYTQLASPTSFFSQESARPPKPPHQDEPTQTFARPVCGECSFLFSARRARLLAAQLLHRAPQLHTHLHILTSPLSARPAKPLPRSTDASAGAARSPAINNRPCSSTLIYP